MNSIKCEDQGSAIRVTQIIRERDNYKWQIKYMCEEIAKALSLPIQTPADTVESVRQLMHFASQHICHQRICPDCGGQAVRREHGDGLVDARCFDCGAVIGWDQCATCPAPDDRITDATGAG